MLNQEVQEALNHQIRHELYSAYAYLSMSAYCESINLSGIARWMRMQGQEELNHAMKFFDFINDRGGRVVLEAIDQPPAEFQSPLDVFERALAHERAVTASIHEIYRLATVANDYPTQVMLHWFIEEQVEEEKSASEIVELLKLSGGEAPALLMLDRQLGARNHSDH
jgi:ferritin